MAAAVAVLLFVAACQHDKHIGNIMAQIDPNIALSVRPLQLDSPVNQMTAVAQLQGLRQQQQLNQLKMQEAQRAEQERNELLQTISGEGFDLNNPAQVQNLLRKAPTLGMPYVKEARMAAAEKAKADKEAVQAENERFQLRKSQLDFTEKALQNSTNPTLARAHIQQAINLKYVTPEVGAQMITSVPEDPTAFETWRANLLTQSMTAKDQLEAAATRQKQKVADDALAYSDYVRSTVLQNPDAKILSKADFLAQRPQAVAPMPASVDGTTTVAAPASNQVATVATDGTKTFPAGEFEDRNLFDPAVAALLATGDPRDKELAQMIEKRTVETRKRQELTGEFQNVVNARKQIEQLKKNPTPTNLAIIKDLEQQIKAASESKGTNVRVNVPVSVSTEKKFGEKFAGNIADKDVALLDAAERAPEAANTANRVLSLLASGQVITGAGANIKLQLAKWLRVAGGSENETIANTEILLSSLADTTLGSIKSSGLGAGQGFTNSDRDFLERAKAGQITYDAASLKRLAELSHRAAQATTDKWNKRSKAIPKSAIEGTGISTEDIRVSPIYKSGGSDKTPPTNAQGWKLEVDKSGNRAYVSPDRKQFEEVK
jgi:hypothetical protein